ncbi:MAG: thiamine phosphate synthase [Bryobacteraceae bacterium]
MLRYYITDRLALGGTEALLQAISLVCAAGIDYLQVREKDLTARELLDLTSRVLAIARPSGVRVLVNDRADVAIAARAGGVHLPSGAIAPASLRGLLPPGGLIAVSCHSVSDVLAAEREGADFVVLGPIFDTPSKRQFGRPLGLAVLHEAATAARIPVLALGGIEERKIPECLAAGAAGIAAIRLFQAAASSDG